MNNKINEVLMFDGDWCVYEVGECMYEVDECMYVRMKERERENEKVLDLLFF